MRRRGCPSPVNVKKTLYSLFIVGMLSGCTTVQFIPESVWTKTEKIVKASIAHAEVVENTIRYECDPVTNDISGNPLNGNITYQWDVNSETNIVPVHYIDVADNNGVQIVRVRCKEEEGPWSGWSDTLGHRMPSLQHTSTSVYWKATAPVKYTLYHRTNLILGAWDSVKEVAGAGQQESYPFFGKQGFFNLKAGM